MYHVKKYSVIRKQCYPRLANALIINYYAGMHVQRVKIRSINQNEVARLF